MTTGIKDGNAKGMWVVVKNLAPSSLATTTARYDTVTIQGVLPGDYVHVTLPFGPVSTNVHVTDAVVTAANTVAVQFYNSSTSTPKSPTAGNYKFLIVRAEDGIGVDTI